MPHLKKLLLALCLPVSMSVTAGPNLLINGGFEAPDIDNNSWEYYTSTHNVSGVPGWEYQGSGMEIWDSLLGVTAFEGEQHAELNAHGANNQAYSFRQSFDTVIGETYNYGFAYRARNDHNESFYAGITGIDTNLFTNHIKGEWSIFSGSFIATDITSTIEFTSADNIGDTTGNLLDGVYVQTSPVVTKVSEPGTIALLGLGLIGLGFARRGTKTA